MIRATHRFHGHNSLNFVYGHGKTVRSGQVSLKFCLNPKRSSYRAAVVVSKKVNKSAVIRNRIRRRIYEIIRVYQPKITEPYDLVFTVFSDQIATMPHKDLLTAIQSTLKAAKLH